MKKFYLLLLLLFPLLGWSQTLVFHENFELPSLDDSVSSSGTAVPWAISTTLYHSGARCDTAKVVAADTSYLNLATFSTLGNSFVMLHFSHICKIEILDAGEIEISTNGGTTWTKLTSTEYIAPPTSQFVNNGNKFNANTYPIDWAPTNYTAVPTNTWWKDETFDISALAGNQASVKIRFALRDGNANGANLNYGWLIDDINVVMSFSELDPPTITYINPQYTGVIYNLGPFSIPAKIQDISGISTAKMYYKINAGLLDSVTMTVQSADTMVALIPAVNDGDTVKYYIRAWDASPALNNAIEPTSGFRSFAATKGIQIPFSTNFDGGSQLFTASTLTPGTAWELGTPAYNSTSGAHSAPNAWDINLTTIYNSDAEAYLYSPIFDFSTANNAVMSFWLNYYTESGWDGTRVDYTVDGTTWNTLGTSGDPLGVNWYNDESINSSTKPAWCGGPSGWVKCEYLLSALNSTVGPVQFRFAFDSDGSGEYDGVSMDDFSIVPPLATDCEVISAITPDFNSCISAGNATLSVAFLNNGTTSISTPFDFIYKLDNQPAVNQTYTESLASAAQDTLVFTMPLTLAAGPHTLKIYHNLAGDGFAANDTLTINFVAHTPLALPYFNNLNAPATLDDFCVLKGAFGRVAIDSVAANTGATGMLIDAVNYSDWVMTIDTIEGNANYIWDPTVNAGNAASAVVQVNSTGYSHLVLKFDAKQIYSGDNLSTNFRVTVNGTRITNHMSPQGANTTYRTYEFDLSAFLPAPLLTIAFEGKNENSYDAYGTGGTATFVDNIQIYEPPAQEASLLAITGPTSGCAKGIEAPVIAIRNSGSDTITGNLQATYTVNGGTPVTPENIPGTILPGDTLFYTFTATVDMSAPVNDTAFHLTAWIQLTGDPFLFNDTANRSVESLFVPQSPVTTTPINIPYATDTVLSAHASGNIYWYADATGSNYIGSDSTFQTPVLYDTAYYYVEARSGSANSDFQIGNGTVQNNSSGYPSPYGQFYNGSHEQYVIPASELLATGMGPGNITALAFDVVTPAGDNLMDLTIKLGTTPLTALSDFASSAFTQVYYNASYASTTGWNTHTFSTPYYWDGTSNLLVDICFDNYPNGYSDNAVVQQTTTTYNSTVNAHSDNGGVCTAGATWTSLYMQRPNIKFTGTAKGCPSPRVQVAVNVMGIPANDAGVVAITTPESAVNLSTEVVAVKVVNFGTNPMSNVPVSYQIDAQAPVTETLTSTVLPGDTADFVFAATADLTAYATYSFKAYTSLTGDVYAINDTINKSVENQFPEYCESTATSTGDDDIISVDFSNIHNVSPLPYTGTYTDNTSETAFVFTGNTYTLSIGIGFEDTWEYDGYCEAYIDFNRDGVFNQTDELVFGGAYTTTEVLSGLVTIPANAVYGITTMRIVAVESGDSSSVNPCGTYSWGETEDYHVFLSPPLQHDAGIAGFDAPATSLSAGVNVPVTVRLRNNGLADLTACPIKWQFNGGTVQTYSWSGNLASATEEAVTLGNVQLGSGVNQLLAYTELPDSNSYNDTARMSSFGLPPISMYQDDFEDSLSAWTPSASSIWQYGVPASTIINAAHSPTQCWKTRLAGNYMNNRTDYLQSPEFDFTTIATPALRFWQWWQAEPNDGGNIQYSIDNGTTWLTLGLQNDPNGVNWYNSFVNGKYQWSGFWTGWQESIYDLSMLGGESSVFLRFAFTSDASDYAYNGWAVDDIEIRVPKASKDLGVSAVLAPQPMVPGGLVHPQVTIHNYGTDTITSTPVCYVNTGGGMIIETWNGVLAPDADANYSFTTSFLMPANEVTFCSFTGHTSDAYHFNDSTCVHVVNSSAVEEYNDYGLLLEQNTPNPASDMTDVAFFIPESGRVKFSITTVFGQEMWSTERNFAAGRHEINIDVKGLSSGMYFYTMEYNQRKLTKKMIIER